MARNDTHIFIGGAEITIDDSINGYKHLGHVDSIQLIGKPRYHKIIDGNLVQHSLEYNFDTDIFDSSQNTINELDTRLPTKQNIYIVGNNNYVVMKDVFIIYGTNRSFSNDEAHTLNIQARTFNEDNIIHYYNLIGVTGSFENDTDNNGIADGWTAFAGTPALVPTFMTESGGTLCQTFNANENYIRCEHIIPFKDRKKITVSGWIAPSGSETIGLNDIELYIGLFDINNVYIDSSIVTNVSTMVSYTSNERLQTSITYGGVNSDLVKYIRVEINGELGSPPILVDNVQVEFGDISDFKNY